MKIRDWAQYCRVSARQLERTIKRILGKSPRDCVNERKLLKAQQLVLADHKLDYIARLVGYLYTQNFCAWFKRQTSLTPREFKDSCWASPWICGPPQTTAYMGPDSI